MEILFFGNGNTGVMNKKGDQVVEFQVSWFRLYLEFLISKGINPAELKYTFPNGKMATVFETKYGFNWKFEE